MDDLTREQAAFRDEVRAWLAGNVPRERLASWQTPEGFAAHRAWERSLYDAGYAGMGWPAEYGGRGADVMMRAIFEEEYFLAGGPERITQIGQNLLGPTLIVHGSEEQKQRWLPGILSGDTIWSQGFSEPNAGSDLAGLRTRAARDGDHWIVNGQKIWTSYGLIADWIFALVRTGEESERHRTITFVCLDITTPGVEVRPIVQLDGHAGFAEVFFTDVRVPVEQTVGDVNAGWSVAMTMLGFERDAPAKPATRYLRDVDALVSLARAVGAGDDTAVRDRIGALYARAEAYRHHCRRALAHLASGKAVGSESSATKVLWSELERDIFEAGREILGPLAELTETGAESGPQAGAGVDFEYWNRRYWYGRAATIYAGTSEIQRNIVAERVLGLPR